MPRILTVVGARPQFIKAAMVSRALRSHPEVDEILVHTGQHYDQNMSDVFFRQLEIPTPDFMLHAGSGRHGAQTGKMLAAIEEVLVQTAPDRVLVYGDTNSTLAGALAAAKLHIPVAHVEAGVRSFNRRMPEEINRVVTDHIADLLLAPTESAVKQLLHEGVPESSITLVGDVMYDAALHYGSAANANRGTLQELNLEPKQYLLATVHRAENTDDLARLRAIFLGLGLASASLPTVLPLHPRTRKAIIEAGLLDEISADLRLIDPVGYLEMLELERGALVIATDSGGVQKEAFFQGVPCVTLRDETEWTELVKLGWNRLVSPSSPRAVADAVQEALAGPSPPAAPHLYGGGRASDQIALQIIASHAASLSSPTLESRIAPHY